MNNLIENGILDFTRFFTLQRTGFVADLRAGSLGECSMEHLDMRKSLGRYIVVDSAICHGQPTFRGTRIFVKDVLDQVASGMAWDAIVEEWRGSVSKAAIGEAVRLASEALLSAKGNVSVESVGK